MVTFDFSFLNNIDERVYHYLELAQNSIEADSHNSMLKVRACAEYMIRDIFRRERIDYILSDDNDRDFYDNINLLKNKNILDKRIFFACHLIRTSCTDGVYDMDSNSEWAQLCIHNVYILSKWYADKYYKVDTNNKPKIEKGADSIEIKEAPVTHIQGREAYANMNMEIKNDSDALLFFASANVLNAYVKQDDAKLLMTPMYEFKKVITAKLEEIIKNDIKNIDIYYGKQITFVKVQQFQFSYKYLPGSEFMDKYENSRYNIPQVWEGIKLQPCAGSLFEYAKLLSNK